jgi:hypothetical protein
MLVLDDQGYLAVLYLGMEQEKRRKEWKETGQQ